MEGIEFENGDGPVILELSEFSLSEEMYFDAKNEINQGLFLHARPCLMFYNEILMEQFKTVVMEKYEFEHRSKSKSLVLLAIFGLIAFWCRE